MFKTRFMGEVLKQMYPPKRFLMDTFFSNQKKVETQNIDIDIRKGKRLLASYINPLQEAKFVERIGYETKSIKLPYTREIMRTGAEDLLNRDIGRHIYDPAGSPAKRAAQQLGEDLAELENRIVRRMEWNAASVLDTGVVNIVGEGVNYSIDFGMNAAGHVVNADTMWDQVGADPLADLASWIKKIEEDSGLSPTHCIMGSDALDKFLADTKVKGLMDMLKVNIGQIQPDKLGDGVIFVGTLKYPGVFIDIYHYSEIYVDGNGAKQNLVPSKHVWLATDKAYTTTFFGPIYNLRAANELGVQGGLISGFNFVPSTWIEDNPSARNLMLESSPLCAMHQCDAFLSATVLS